MWGQHFGNWASNYCAFGPGYGHGFGMFGWIFPLLFWGVVIYAVISIVRSLFGGRRDQQNDIAMETLRNRFASGEISENEFLAQKAVLSRR